MQWGRSFFAQDEQVSVKSITPFLNAILKDETLIIPYDGVYVALQKYFVPVQ